MLASTVLWSRDGVRPSAVCATVGDTDHHESAAARMVGGARARRWPPARFRGSVLWGASKCIGGSLSLDGPKWGQSAPAMTAATIPAARCPVAAQTDNFQSVSDNDLKPETRNQKQEQPSD